MKRRLGIAILVVAVAAAALFGYRRWSHRSPDITLLTAPVTRGAVVETVDATGTLQAVTTVQVGTQISGTIKALYADFNSEVRKGQVIAELDPSLLQTQVEQARATIVRLQADADRAQVELEDARTKWQRAKELSDRQLISRNDLETAESTMKTADAAQKAAQAQVVQARASLNQNSVNLGHTVIRAPIDGIVISRNVDVGQTVAASMQAPTLFVIARDLTQMQVSASVNESDIGRIQPGQKVSFRVDAYGNQTFEGTVSQVRLQPVVEQNVVSYTTVIDVPNEQLKLKPGMTANVTMEVARADDALRVPNPALRFRPTPEVFASLGQEPRAPGSQMPNGEQRPASSWGQGRRAQQTGTPGQAGTTSVGTAGGPGREDGPSRARVWVLEGGKLRPFAVKTGISDGVMTAVVGGEIPEGAQVVTGVASTQSAASTPQTGSPLLPFGGRGRRGAAGQGGSGTTGGGGNRR